MTNFFEVWDNRECVSRHGTFLSAHRTIVQARDPRTLRLYDLMGRIAGIYKDGREWQKER